MRAICPIRPKSKKASKGAVENMNTIQKIIITTAAVATVFLCAPSVQAVVNASDNACSAGYGTGNYHNQNGGFGFLAWQNTPSSNGSNAGMFIGNSNNNGGGGGPGINCGANRAFGIYANNGATAQAIRHFVTHGNLGLQNGQVFQIEMDNGWHDGSNTSAGFGLQNSSGGNRFEFYHRAGNGNYFINDSTANFDTGIPFTDGGLVVTVTITGVNTYSVHILRKSNNQQATFNRTFGGTSGTRVDRVRAFYFNNFSGGSERDFFVNNLSIECSTPPTISCPPDVAICSVDSTDPSNTGTATASGGCGALTIGHSDVVTSTQITRTWTVTDASGNTAQCVQIITLEPTLCPCTIQVSCPDPVSLDADPITCIAPAPDLTGLVGVTLTPSDCATYTVTQDPAPGTSLGPTCGPGGSPHIITLTVTDDGDPSNFATCTVEVSVNDVTPPVVTAPADLLLECDDPVPAPGGATAEDACDGALTPTLVSDVSVGDICTGITITRTWNATDACNNTGSAQQIIEILPDTEPPVLTVPADVTVECSDDTSPAGTGQATAVDACSTVTVSFVDSIAAGSCPAESVITRTWTAVDACGNDVSDVQIITVVDTTPPVISCGGVPGVLLELDGSDGWNGWTLATTSGDVNQNGHFFGNSINNNGTGGDSNSDGDIGNPAWGMYANTAQTAFAIYPLPSLQPGDVFELSIDNGSVQAGGQVGFALVSGGVTRFEILFPGGAASYWINDSLGFQDSGIPFTREGLDVEFALTGVDTYTLTVTRLVDGSVYQSSGTLAGTAGLSINSLRVFNFNAGTGSGADFFFNHLRLSQSVPVDDTLPADENSIVDVPDYTGLAVASDNCGSVTIAQDPAPGLQVLGEGTYDIVLIATDECGNSSSCIVGTITVQDGVPPTIDCPAPQTVPADANCEGVVPDFTTGAVVSDNVTAPEDIVVTQSPPAGSVVGLGVTVVTLTATDEAGNSASCDVTLTVIDTTPPSMTCPADLTVGCASQIPPPDVNAVTASDACGPVTVTLLNVTDSGAGCPADPRVIVRTYQAVDGSGNEATCDHTITVVDDTPPAIDCTGIVLAEDATNDLGGSAWQLTPGGGGFFYASSTENNSGDPSSTPGGDINTGGLAWGLFNDALPTTEATRPLGTSIAVGQTLFFDMDNGNVPNGGVGFNLRNSANNTRFAVVFNSGDTQYSIVDGSGVSASGIGFTRSGIRVAFTLTGVDTYSATITRLIDNQSQTVTGTLAGPAGSAIDRVRVFNAVQSGGTANNLYFNSLRLEWTLPELVTLVADGNCEAVVPDFTGLASATDSCDPAPVIVQTPAPGSLVSVGTHSVTLTATDACGNTSAPCLVAEITVVDTTPPSISCPADVTLTADENCEAALPDLTGAATVSDNCESSAAVTVTQSPPAGTLVGLGSTVVTLTATDAAGNSSSCDVTVTVVDTTAPVLSGVPADTTVECDAVPAPATVTAQDNCAGAVAVSFNETASGNCPVILVRTWTATDDFGNTTSESQTITVVDTTAPDLVVPADVTLECPADTDPLVTGEATATDDCGSVTVTFSDDVTPGCGNTLTIARTWTATDECGNSSSGVQTIEVVDTTAPALVVPADITLECPADTDPLVTGEATATDDCGSVTVTFSDDVTPGCGNTLTIARTWTATDECGNSSSGVQTIEVVDTTPPTLVIPADETVECDAIPPVGTASATDACNPNVTVTFDGEVWVYDDCSGRFTVERTWTATDACGNSTTLTQTITAQDTTPPVLTIPADETVECDAIPPVGVASATDNCDPDVAVVFDGEVTVSGACPDSYSLLRTWTATDDCGNSTTLTQTITVQDTTPPVLVGVPADVAVECDAVPAPATVTATDNCDAAPVVSLSEDILPGACAHSYTLVRTWTATDACGNATSQSQTITVVDTTAPVLTPPADVTVECDASTDPSSTGMATAVDACDAAPTITYSDAASGACPTIIVRTWTAMDACGNSVSADQIITVVDTTPPTLVGVPADETAECDAVPAPATVTAVDNCDAAPVVTFEEIITVGACEGSYTIVRTWTATDECGNSASQLQTITVVDTTAPFVTPPADVTVECDESTDPAETGTATAVDNCDPNPGVTYTDTVVAGSCPQEYTIVRTWTATDDCGNSASADQIISVVDTTPPTIVAPPNVTTSMLPPADFAGGLAEDNCGDVTVTHVGDNSVVDAAACAILVTRTYQAEDECGNTATATQIITQPLLVDPSDPILWLPPLARPGVNPDTDPSNGGTLRYNFRGNRTIPIQIRVRDCNGNNVSANPNIIGVVQVFADVNCDFMADGNEEPIDFNGVGGDGGVMSQIDNKLKYNLDTKSLVTQGCYVLRITITDVSTGVSAFEEIYIRRL